VIMKPYKTYFFRGQDPMLAEAISRIFDEGTPIKKLSEASGVASSTFYNWKRKKSKRTYASTLNAALRSAGMRLEIASGLKKNGSGK